MLRNGLHEFVGCEGLSESEEAMIPRIRFQLVKVLGEFVFVTGADGPDADGSAVTQQCLRNLLSGIGGPQHSFSSPYFDVVACREEGPAGKGGETHGPLNTAGLGRSSGEP